MTNRNFSFDTLRTLAILLVIVLHVSAPYVVEGMGTKRFDTDFWIGNIIDSFSRVCVPLFIMISGRFLILNSDSYKVFYRKRIIRIIPSLIFWCTFYLLYSSILELRAGKSISLYYYFDLLFTGRPFYHLWFIFMLIGLYMITPLFNNIIKKLKEKTLYSLSFFLVIFGFFLDIYDIIYQNKPFFLFWFVNYIGYFLFGYMLGVNSRYISNFLLIGIYIIASLFNSFLVYYSANEYSFLYFHSFLSPIVIISSLVIYLLFCQLTIPENILSKASHLVFGVYLIHAVILDVFERIVKDYNFYLLENAAIGISIKFTLVCIISYSLIKMFWYFKWARKFI